MNDNSKHNLTVIEWDVADWQNPTEAYELSSGYFKLKTFYFCNRVMLPSQELIYLSGHKTLKKFFRNLTVKRVVAGTKKKVHVDWVRWYPYKNRNQKR